MLGFTAVQRYYLSRQAADMRKSYDGLSGLVRQGLGRDPLSGEVFIFLNRRRTHKLLVWDRSGFCDLEQAAGAGDV
ncbi:MAG: IS66 family insertion sequence element accessory protein TnpB [Saprospirales bacterium]|nr:IS66 family insertion sequence element accessory protein TnpB [Saprospirales bacterium]